MIRTRIKNNIEGLKNTASAALLVTITALIFLSLSPTPYAAQSDVSINSYLNKADLYYKEGRYKEAILSWDKVLSADPNNALAARGIKDAELKMAKIKDFFGSNIFKEFATVNEFSIEDCVSMAVEHSIPLEVAREQMKLANIKVWEARRSFFPELSLSWTRTSGIQSDGKVEGLEYGIEGKQPAFHSGGIMYTLAQSKVDLSIAESNYDKVRNELYFEVAQAYYSLIKIKKQLEYTQDIYNEVKPIYEMIKKAYEKSAAPTIEFLNAESSFNQLYYQIISDENEVQLTKLNLEQKLGIEDIGGINIVFDNEPSLVTRSLKECLELAIEHRPDLKMGFYIVKYAEYGKKIADTKEMPRVDLVGNYKKSSEVYRESYSAAYETQLLDPHKKWYIGVEASVPFLGSTASYSYFRRHDPASLSTFQPDSEQSGTTWKFDVLNNIKNFSEIEQAKIANVKAEQELDDARKKAIMEVKGAFYGYEKSRVQLTAAKAQKEYREKEFKILKFKKSMGEGELSDLFEAVTKLIEANTFYCDAEANLNISVAGLNKAIGIEDYF
ncbi:MAG: TolC family protein [Candidatus Omnitrophica bacterium]|nr:TolC family protein [Candidatus Omnitrophota bacterium]MBU4488429.1 TolC family protein [Candidatus Omnitrophota bacterium]MCG2704945.1 TolC family protein [Candidatus Omnitrophota bacterium]